jgi:hypothetical protein
MYIMDLSPRVFTIKRASVISHLGLNDIFICMVYEECIQDLNLRLSIQAISTTDQKWIIFFFSKMINRANCLVLGTFLERGI